MKMVMGQIKNQRFWRTGEKCQDAVVGLAENRDSLLRQLGG